jgi:hypothetical protein
MSEPFVPGDSDYNILKKILQNQAGPYPFVNGDSDYNILRKILMNQYGASFSVPDAGIGVKGIALPAMYQVTEVYEWADADGAPKNINLFSRLQSAGIVSGSGVVTIISVVSHSELSAGSASNAATFALDSDSSITSDLLIPISLINGVGSFQEGPNQLPITFMSFASSGYQQTISINAAPGAGETTTVSSTYYVIAQDQAVVVP